MTKTVIYEPDKDPYFSSPAHWMRPTFNDQPGFVDIFKGPDDEDFLYKAVRMLRITVPSTIFFATFDCTLFSFPKNVLAAAARGVYWGVPLIGGGLAYNCTVTTLSSIRGKSDQINHMCGGFAAAAVLGAARKSIYLGVCMSAVLGFTGALFKDSIIHDYRVLPYLEGRLAMRGNPYSHKMDWSVLPLFPKFDEVTRERLSQRNYWARSEEEARKLMEESDFDFNECIRLRS